MWEIIQTLHPWDNKPWLNPLKLRQNGRHFANDTLNRICMNENVRILIKISLKFAPKGSINNIPALVQIMAWRRPGDKPLSKPMMVSLLTHICVTRPQWVNDVSYVVSGVFSWWRHQMETFTPLLALCVGNSPSQRPVTWSFDVFFDLCLE